MTDSPNFGRQLGAGVSGLQWVLALW